MKSQVFILINGFFRIHYVLLISLLAVIVDAKYPVRIDGSDIKYSPRFIGRSSVIYQGAMYVYGGESAADESSRYSNNMHKYTFDTEKDIVSMSLVKQVNTGPNCTFCGAVMIDDHRMMILTHDYASITDPRNSLATTVVHPYIFDFTSLTWNSSISNPSYTAEASNFRMRTRHTTVIHDEVIYTLGGADYYENSTVALNTSWYYDIKTHSYGIINNNGFDYRSIGGCSFNLPNNTIGSIFGKKIDPIEYNSDRNMMILDTNSKAWIENKNLTSSAGPSFEGMTVQISRQKDNTPSYAYFFGGFSVTGKGKSLSASDIRILNLQNNTWLNVDTVHREKDKNYALPRSYASSALILDKYFIIVSGKTERSNSAGVADLDIVQLPKYRAENAFEENQNGRVELVYVPSLSNHNFIEKAHENSLSPAAKFFIVFFSVSAVLLLSIYVVVKIGGPKSGQKKGLIGKIAPPSFLWHRQPGESFTTQISRCAARIIFFAIFIGFLYFFVNNIINSPVSSTTEFIEKENITFPDIRFCYSGWPRFQFTPRPGCNNINAPSWSTGCTIIEDLDSDIFVPSFAEQYGPVFCKMYRSDTDNGGSTVPRLSSTLKFVHNGVLTDNGQRLRIQFYEPNKNPNRVLYFNEEIQGLDSYTMDAWMDSEVVSGSTNNTVNQMVYLYMDSTVYIQFKTITTKQIDPDSLWNYVGIFPKYKIKTELTVTHTESMKRGEYKLMPLNSSVVTLPGVTHISPADYFDTVITEKRNTTIVSVLGVIGGIVSLLLFVQAILFGTRPSAPWGLIQNSTLSATNRASKKKNLSKYFLIPESGGLPLETPVHSRFSDIYNLHERHKKNDDFGVVSQEPDETMGLGETYGLVKTKEGNEIDSKDNENPLIERLNQLEARNQILELVLKTYYIDDKIFRELQELSQQSPT